MISVRPLTGSALDEVLRDVAQLRINVFRAFPYLYDGDMEFEERYLGHYRDSESALLVGAFESGKLVGASTALPLLDHEDDFAAAFEGSGLDPADIFYCAESILLPEYRGKGIGHQFFDTREDHARQLGFPITAFCSVVRDANHPERPANYRALDGFWLGRGYTPRPDIVTEFQWKDVGDDVETSKPMQFWIHHL